MVKRGEDGAAVKSCRRFKTVATFGNCKSGCRRFELRLASLSITLLSLRDISPIRGITCLRRFKVEINLCNRVSTDVSAAVNWFKGSRCRWQIQGAFEQEEIGRVATAPREANRPYF